MEFVVQGPLATAVIVTALAVRLTTVTNTNRRKCFFMRANLRCDDEKTGWR